MTQNKQNLDTTDFGNFDVTADSIANNALGIRMVDGIKIVYGAINVNGAAVWGLGGIAVPELAPKSIKGIILFFHGTTVERGDVRPNLSPAPIRPATMREFCSPRCGLRKVTSW